MDKENKETKTERPKINLERFEKVTEIPEIVRGGEAKASVLKLSKLMVKGEIRKYSFDTVKDQRTLASRIYKYGSEKDIGLESSIRNENDKFLVFVQKV